MVRQILNYNITINCIPLSGFLGGTLAESSTNARNRDSGPDQSLITRNDENRNSELILFDYHSIGCLQWIMHSSSIQFVCLLLCIIVGRSTQVRRFIGTQASSVRPLSKKGECEFRWVQKRVSLASTVITVKWALDNNYNSGEPRICYSFTVDCI